jgi:hypothetical protein
MGRNVTADKTPLLMNAEQNIGNSTILHPQVGQPTVIPTTNPPRILNLTGGSAVGQTVSIAMSVSRIIQGNENPNPGFPGPITGIVEFGNGGRFTKIEFDLVVGPFAGPFTEALSALEPQDGVVIVTVPTGVLRVYARYDNLLLAPILGTDPPMSQVQYSNSQSPFPGYPVVGPGGPLLVSPSPLTGGSDFIVPSEPVLVKAMAAYFTKTRSKIYKTINCYVSPETTVPVAIPIGNPTAATPAGYLGYAFYALPPYTKSVKVQRFPGVAVDVLLHDGVRPVEYINIFPTPTSPPTIDIVGNESIIGINSLGNKLNMLKLVCEVGV